MVQRHEKDPPREGQQQRDVGRLLGTALTHRTDHSHLRDPNPNFDLGKIQMSKKGFIRCLLPLLFLL